RKPFIILGYALSVVIRPLIALSHGIGVVVFVRFVEKVGKSLRTAPRDALIADLSAEEARGANFGIHRALDTVGAVRGLLAVYFFFQFGGQNEPESLRRVILMASAAGVLALPILMVFVHEAPHHSKPQKIQFSLKALDDRLKRYLIISFLFALANSSDAF